MSFMEIANNRIQVIPKRPPSEHLIRDIRLTNEPQM